MSPTALASARPQGTRHLPLAPLVELAAAAPSAGAKAHTLARALALGLPVPRGWVLPSPVFLAHARAAGLPAAPAAGLDPREHAAARARSAAFARGLSAIALAPEVHDALADLADHARALGLERLIVRSSAEGEDAPQASCAGLLESVVCAPEDLGEALLEVWASLASPRVLLYQAARGVRLTGCGVLIQPYLDARAAGVLFTCSPDPAHGGAPLLEYTFGQGAELVQGNVSPGRYLLPRGATPEHLASAPGESAAEGAALREVLGELAVLGWTLADAFGGPQDLEWVLEADGALQLVQARPITVRTPPARLRWSNANVNENYPEPLTPFLYSVARESYANYFRALGAAAGLDRAALDAARPQLETAVGVHAGRIYYNLSHIHELLRLLPRGEDLAETFNRFTGAAGVSPARRSLSPGQPDQPGRPGRLGRTLALGRVLGSTAWSLACAERNLRRFEGEVDDYAAATRRLEGKQTLALCADLRAFLHLRFRRWTPAGVADAAAMLGYGAVRGLLARAFPEHPTRVNDLLSGLADVVSGEPVDALWALGRLLRASPRLQAHFAHPDPQATLAALAADPECAEFQGALERWLERWGFRCSGELLLTRPSYQDEPQRLVPLIRAYAELESAGPGAIQARQETVRRVNTRRALASLRGVRGRALAWALSLSLAWTRRAIAWRERARLKQALLYARLRGVVLALGARLVDQGLLSEPADAWFLTHAELIELGSGVAMFPRAALELVALRRRAHAEVSAETPPDAFELAEGRYLEPGGRGAQPAPSTVGARPSPGDANDQDGLVLRGTAASAGLVRGRAIVLDDVSEAERLRPGDVLVVRQTDPGWAPVFFLLGGLVLERGGMLSHGAILAREYGIPTVVDVESATTRVPTGAEVELDGEAGSLRILSA